MSACAVLSLPVSAFPSPSPRKRTTSFSFGPSDADAHTSSRPAKAPRMGSSSLRRSDSIVLLPTPAVDAVPYSRTLSYYKEQRQRRKMNQRSVPSEHLTIKTTPPSSCRLTPAPVVAPKAASKATKPPIAPSKVILPSVSCPITTYQTPRRSSPLSPCPTILPGRPVFPRSKPSPNLHRTAIKMRMLSTEQGKKILSLGPRLAMEIMQTSKDIWRVTQELEDMVGEVDAEGDDDIVMGDSTSCEDETESDSTTETPASSPVDSTPPPIPMPATPQLTTTPLPPLQPLMASYTPPTIHSAAPSSPPGRTPAPPVLTTSWVVVRGEDWEMVDCAA